jgi:hypothetical protein
LGQELRGFGVIRVEFRPVIDHNRSGILRFYDRLGSWRGKGGRIGGRLLLLLRDLRHRLGRRVGQCGCPRLSHGQRKSTGHQNHDGA